MVDRVAVFIDYQNVYMGARGAFELRGHHAHGQVWPLRVGLALRSMGLGDRELVDVRVYRGMPSAERDPKGYGAACEHWECGVPVDFSAERDPKGYGAADRQTALWRNSEKVTVTTRPLNYRDPAAPKEKGIDVQIAVDFVRLAIEQRYDVGVLFSADTDILPALEAVCELRGDQACEVAAWVPTAGSPSVLRIKGKHLRYHYLDRSWYDRVHDETDYNVRRRRR